MQSSIYFPSGIVTGEAFCNRQSERNYLKNCLDQNAHVVLMSPRRYGKSSLIAQFVQDQNIPFSAVDFLPATSGKYIKNVIVDGVTELLNAITPKTKKAKQTMLSNFVTMNPTIELSAFGQKVRLSPDEKSPEETIMKLLLSLDNAANDLGKQLVFVMDEFQQIAALENAHSLEASIRHAVERSRHVFYIFSGSNRTLLQDMFSNKDRPLYHLCDDMKLQKIESKHYLEFIKQASQRKWRKEISDECINTILTLTQCHPYYVNRLCRLLWDDSTSPSIDAIEETWGLYVDSQKPDWVSDMISHLALNQKAVLIGLAKEPVKELRGKGFSKRVGLSSSSIQRTIEGLIKRDLIYSDENGWYHVLNPVVKTVLADNKYID